MTMTHVRPQGFTKWKHPEPTVFRRAMGHFPTGVTVITCGNGEQTEAMTASSVTSGSLDPMLVLISIGPSGRLCAAIDEHGRFAINVLAQGQERLSTVFAARDRPTGLAAQHSLRRLAGEPLVGDTGVLLVPGAVLSLECRTEFRYPGGDHVLFLGRVEALHMAEPSRSPLLYHRGAYSLPAE